MVCCRRSCVTFYVTYLALGTTLAVVVTALFGLALTPLLTTPAPVIKDSVVAVAVVEGVDTHGSPRYVVVRRVYQEDRAILSSVVNIAADR